MTGLLLKVSNLHKRYPGVHALDGVQLDIRHGEVHALLGENGAGKSTLLKTLAGAVSPDEGEMKYGGTLLDRRETPHQRQNAGIVTIYQEFNLVPLMSVAENIFLGREPRRRGFIDRRQMHEETDRILARLGLKISPETLVANLSVASQQLVEIARALTLDARLLIMDEPTAALSGSEVDRLHEVIRDLKASGVSIIYVTHRLAEVMTICDRYTVLRDGKFITSADVADASIGDLVKAMVGRNIQPATRQPGKRGELALSVEGVCGALGRKQALHDLSLSVHEGEVIGLGGLVGSGRTELARLVFGADPGGSGTLWMGADRKGLFRSPQEAMASGFALLPEDRKAHGCFMAHSVRWNLSLPSLGGMTKMGLFVNERAEREMVDSYMQRLRIRAPNDNAMIGALSGGNQQKVLLARCMALRPKVLVVDEPTRGVDVGAKAEVHQILFDLAESGVAVIVISSDLPELIELSDRICVLHEGHYVGEVDRADADEARLMAMMTGQISNSNKAQREAAG